MTNTAADRLLMATSVSQARDALGEGRVALAGGTWLMRAAVRGEALPARFVSLGGIAALRRYHELPRSRSIWRQIEIPGVPAGMLTIDR